jgi:hypothetical protein
MDISIFFLHTSNWARPPSNRSLVATWNRPQQVYNGHVPTPSHYAPTNIDVVMHTLSLNVPDEN